MGEPLENLYFNWLYAKVADPRAHSPSRTFESLLGELHRIEFVWTLTGDDNRAEDGRDLRREFLMEARMSDLLEDDLWENEPCSVLEMLIAFSRKAAFVTDESDSYWFWIMLENLGLAELHDGNRVPVSTVRSIIDAFIWRSYDRSGHGGLFPLLRSRIDQRRVEIWYQFNEYIQENEC